MSKFVTASQKHPACGSPAAKIIFAAFFLGLVGFLCLFAAQARERRVVNLESRSPTRAWLNMPSNAAGAFPPLLSQTGAFKDTRTLAPADGLVPYDLNVSFWSDGAEKTRWIAAPCGSNSAAPKIGFTTNGEWTFPPGTVFVKHFDCPVDDARPDLRRRLETRLLVLDSTGSVYGVTYKWRPDNSDADLLATNLTETLVVKTAAGTRELTWYYPSRQDCKTCHTDRAGGVLGVKTRQLNCDFAYDDNAKENQLAVWNRLGLFNPPLSEDALPKLLKLARADDESRSLEERARSYLDANCAHCHRPGGTVASFDTRYDTPLEAQGLINGPVLINQGIDKARPIAPNDIWRSIIFLRVNTIEAVKMPPLAHSVLDRQAVELLRRWIQSLDGPPVLAPPAFSLHSGNFARPVEIILTNPEPGAVIHYTLDGTVPNESDPLFEKSIRLNGPTTLRARAFKHGFTKSITAQETYIIGE
jgi:uncharacterized repeat protein (TIGR03806 family)